METEGSFVSGLGYVILGSFYRFTASGASSPYGFLWYVVPEINIFRTATFRLPFGELELNPPIFQEVV